MKSQIKLLDKQLIISLALGITLIISIFLNYDEKQKLLNKKRLFHNNDVKYINLFNRVLFLIILLYNLYINYEQYELEKEKGNNTIPFIQQIYASILNVIAAIIILYVIYETYNNDNIASFENTI